MATIRILSTGKFRVEVTKNYTFIQSKTFISKILAQQYADAIELQIETILSLTPKKIRKLTPAKVENLGGLDLFKKLGVHVEFIKFQQLHDEYMNQWTGKDIANQTIRARYWLSLFKDKPIKGVKPKDIKNAVDGLRAGLFDSYGKNRKAPKVLSNNPPMSTYLSRKGKQLFNRIFGNSFTDILITASCLLLAGTATSGLMLTLGLGIGKYISEEIKVVMGNGEVAAKFMDAVLLLHS